MSGQMSHDLSISTIGIVVFNGVERLDVEGPLGVLSWADRWVEESMSFHLASMDGHPVEDHLLRRSIPVDGKTTHFAGFDLLLIPGGNLDSFGNDQDLVSEIRRLGTGSKVVASVCTGAFLIAQTGMAEGKTMTTHHAFKERFRQAFPRVRLAEKGRFVKDGLLWSSAGISAGIDMSLSFVIEIWGESVARQVQSALEYYPEPPFDS